MNCVARFLALIGVFLTCLGLSDPARAQPAPSFRSDCGELRAALRGLDRPNDRLVVIQVTGDLRQVHFDGALAYMLMCEMPDPQVLCVTYSLGDRKAGDRVALVGTLNQVGPDHVLLDPCLHAPPDP